MLFLILFEKIKSFNLGSTESKPILNFALAFDDKRVKKDPRLGYTISNKLIKQFGTQVL